MKSNGLKRLLYTSMLFLLGIVVMGCQINILPPQDAVGSFSDYDEIENYLKQFYEENQSGYYYRSGVDGLFAEAAMEDATSGQNSAPKSYSVTNTQEEGIAESDTFVTDGYHLYLVRYNQFVIVDAETLDIVFTYDVTSGYLQGMFLVGDKVVLFGYEYFQKDVVEREYDYWYWNPWMYQTKVVVFDVSDKADVVIDKTLAFDNTYLVDVRMIDEYLYLVLDNYVINYGFDEESFIPQYYDSAVGSGQITLPASSIFYSPVGNELIGYLMLVSYNVADDTEADVKAYLGSSYQIYMSENNLYSVVYRYVYDEENNTYDFFAKILRFELVNHALVFQAVGTVNGSPLDQFSMDEYDGVFRIATTDYNYTITEDIWEQNIVNGVYLLDATSVGEMTPIGELTGLGKTGERIYAVRYDDELAYVVTFIQTDPLYKLDLTDPANPVILGEYFEEGVSDYLHIVSSSLMLGIGRNSVPNQWGGTWLNGVKVSLYNTSGDTPELITSFNVEGQYSYTPVQYDHKAFVYYPRPDLGVTYFAIPVFEYYNYWSNYSQNLYIYQITDAGVMTQVGELTHLVPVEEGTEYWQYYWDSIERALMIEGNIYTVSQNKIMMFDLLNGLTPLDELVFQANPIYSYPTDETKVD